MTTDSSIGGYIYPGLPEPWEDEPLQAFLQSVVVGITGLNGSLVRPRWQPEPGNLPPFGTTWAAVGETDRDVEDYAAFVHRCENDLCPEPGKGYDTFLRNEVLHLLVSFYGPRARTYAGILRDGLQLSQNREVMLCAGYGLASTGSMVTAPELIKERWLYRVDQPFSVRRIVERRYDNQNLLCVQLEGETIVGPGCSRNQWSRVNG